MQVLQVLTYSNMVATTCTDHEFFTYVLLCGVTSDEKIDFFYELNIPFSNLAKIKSSFEIIKLE